MGGRTVERMNAQTRYGLVALLLAVLFWLLGAATDGDAFLLAGTLALFAGIVLLIVGLVRRPHAVQPRQD